MEVHNVQVRWSPGHTGIGGNELADRIANAAAKNPTQPRGLEAEPTVSDIRSITRIQLQLAAQDWWATRKAKLSGWYTQWGLIYTLTAPEELGLPRPVLARLLAIRSKHGDFAWYHTKFKHDDANIECSCGRLKTPEHLVHCRKAVALFNK
jgi:hypothetical protein